MIGTNIQHVTVTEAEYRYFAEHRGELGIPIVYLGKWIDPDKLEAWRKSNAGFPSVSNQEVSVGGSSTDGEVK